MTEDRILSMIEEIRTENEADIKAIVKAKLHEHSIRRIDEVFNDLLMMEYDHKLKTEVRTHLQTLIKHSGLDLYGLLISGSIGLVLKTIQTELRRHFKGI